MTEPGLVVIVCRPLLGQRRTPGSMLASCDGCDEQLQVSLFGQSRMKQKASVLLCNSCALKATKSGLLDRGKVTVNPATDHNPHGPMSPEAIELQQYIKKRSEVK